MFHESSRRWVPQSFADFAQHASRFAEAEKGTTCCIFNQVQTMMGQWKAGKLRLLGVSTRNRINAAVKAAIDTPSVRDRLVQLGNTPRWETPEQFRATVKADRVKWAAVVKEIGATID